MINSVASSKIDSTGHQPIGTRTFLAYACVELPRIKQAGRARTSWCLRGGGIAERHAHVLCLNAHELIAAEHEAL